VATFTGTTKNDTLTGGADNDQLFGLAGNDSLTGGLGNDILDGGLGVDTMVGGQGNDSYRIDALGETIVEAVNEGRDRVIVGNAAALTKAIDNVEDYVFTDNARVSFSGNAGDNSITGATASDTLFGEAGNDTLNGGAGADLLEGGDGNDIYVVDNAGDIVRETKADISGGVDLVLSSVSFILGSGVDRLELIGTAAVNGTGNELANNLRGNNAANRISTLGGNDAFDGVGGNDTLDGGLGADTMFGGTGNDTYFVDDLGDVVIEEFSGAKGGVDTVFANVNTTLGDIIILADNIENLTLIGNGNASGLPRVVNGNALNNVITGSDSNDNLIAFGGNDTLIGGAGKDDLEGGDGNDLLMGGTGNDTYGVKERGDRIVESVAGLAGGFDKVIFEGDGDFTLGANLEELVLSSTTARNGAGNELGNRISGNNDANRLLGLAGADTLIGAAGDDTLDGGKGTDTMFGGIGNDVYIVDDVADVVSDNLLVDGGTKDEIRTTLSVFGPVDGVENYTFLGGAVNFAGNDLNNVITGSAGNDTLDGGVGLDTLNGGSGNDVLIGNDNSDKLFGGIGNDTLSGDGADDTIDGGVGNDKMSGGGGSDAIVGGAGNDFLAGDDGNDTLDGGDGNDTLVLDVDSDTLVVDKGNDLVILQTVNGSDVIVGFDGNATGGQDKLSLDAFFDQLGIANADRAALVEIKDEGSTVKISVDSNRDSIFESVAVLQTNDAITMGSDIILS
jgi:Ca2+-binding RTX toxin-like protein